MRYKVTYVGLLVNYKTYVQRDIYKNMNILNKKYAYIYIYTRIIKYVSRLFRMGTHETLVTFEVISSGCNSLVVPFQQLLEGPMEVFLYECVKDLCQSFFHLLRAWGITKSHREQGLDDRDGEELS